MEQPITNNTSPRHTTQVRYLPYQDRGDPLPIPWAPTLLPEGEALELPLLLHRKMCLPGQHFRITGLSLAAAMFICDMDPPKVITFGMVVLAPGETNKISRYGVTFDAGPNGDYIDDVSFRSRGKQRFRGIKLIFFVKKYTWK